MKKEYNSFLLRPASDKKNEKKATAILNKELTIFSIEKAKEEFDVLLDNFKEVTLSLKKVENIDLSYLQLIYAFRNAAEQKQIDVTIEGQLPKEQHLLIEHSGLTKVLESNI
ncbi:MAG: STAS domain-containing protein [Bacteroidales bacterium]|jgi:ABC-type transporter Mla MlaB component